MHINLRAVATGLFFLALIALPRTVLAKSEPSKLALLKAKLRLRTEAGDAAPRDSIRLVMSVTGRTLPRSWNPTRDELEVTIGGRVVTRLPSTDPNATTRFRDDRWICREKKSPDREGRRKLIVDFARGRIAIRAKGLDLSGIEVTDLTVEVKLDGETWNLTLPLARSGTNWSSSGRPVLFERLGGSPGPVPGPGPMPDPDPDPDPVPMPPITWQEMVWGHDWSSSLPRQIVANTQSEYDALWSQARGTLSKPAVDFSKWMVVGIFAGNRLNAKVEIVSVKRGDSGIVVTYRIVADTNRYFAPPPPYPHYLFTMTKTSERILFSLVP